MEYKARIVWMKFKQVEVKGEAKAILTVRYEDQETLKVYPQDLWLPTEATSEKAEAYFDKVLDTIGTTREHFAMIVQGNWEGALQDPEYIFNIETEVDKRGYEKVKYVNDPANPGGGGSEITDPNLMKILGITKTKSEQADEIPFD